MSYNDSGFGESPEQVGQNTKRKIILGGCFVTADVIDERSPCQ